MNFVDNAFDSGRFPDIAVDFDGGVEIAAAANTPVSAIAETIYLNMVAPSSAASQGRGRCLRAR
jgi:hypothetical protein